MVKAQQLYVKHLYSTGEEQDEDQKKNGGRCGHKRD